MSNEGAKGSALRHKAGDELREWLMLTVYLAFFFVAFEVYRNLVMREQGLAPFRYGFALAEALVVGKFILIGRAMHLATRHHRNPTPVVGTLVLALAYGLLVLAFSVIEHVLEGLIRGTGPAAVLREIASRGLYELLGRTLVMFVALVPLFALYTLAGMLGSDRLWPLFFRRTA